MTNDSTTRRLPQIGVEAAAWVIERVCGLGCRRPVPRSRLFEMHRVLSRGYVAPDDPEFDTALESIRDLHNLVFIFDQLEAHGERETLERMVRHLLNDSTVPQNDLKNSPGRDKQFELYLMAICHNAQMLPIGYDEPDITCTVNGTRFGIAVKRIKSRNPGQLERHVRKAAEQLDGQGLPGIVALNLSLSRDQKNTPLVQLREQLERMVTTHNQMRNFDERVREWVAGSKVVGVMVYDSIIRLRHDAMRWWHTGQFNWVPILKDGEPDPLFVAFWDGFDRGIPNKETDES